MTPSIGYPASFNPRARTGRDVRGHGLDARSTVSIHAPARGATELVHDARTMLKFQSTRPHGARPEALPVRAMERTFQSTRPHGARRLPPVPTGRPSAVSIHAPARGATNQPRSTGLPISFQSTRPHGARRYRASDQRHEQPVSIHAPARGATLGSMPIDHESEVSIHAPARGATVAYLAGRYGRLFQSTRPHGARLALVPMRLTRAMFQSTRPHGARQVRHVRRVQEVGFQSTRPHGARPDEAMHAHGRLIVSIHAPARGATWHPSPSPRTSGVSIHAPARGATCATTHQGVRPGCFNPRARTGRDALSCARSQTMTCFNPRARTGRDDGHAYSPHP